MTAPSAPEERLIADDVRATCCACGDDIEQGFDVRDDDGNVYCEGCWAP